MPNDRSTGSDSEKVSSISCTPSSVVNTFISDIMLGAVCILKSFPTSVKASKGLEQPGRKERTDGRRSHFETLPCHTLLYKPNQPPPLSLTVTLVSFQTTRI